VAIRNFFRGGAEPGGEERSLRDPQQILAWLEELSRLRTSLDLAFPGLEDQDLTATVDGVGEETATLTLGLPRLPVPEPAPGQRATFVFPLDGHRYLTEAVYQDRGGYLAFRFKLPASIKLAERRGGPRIHFGARDRCQVVALQALAEGLALTGELVDLSMGGCAFAIQRAVRVKEGRRVSPRPDLLDPDTPLALVRLPDLPRLPLIECAGRVSNLRPGPTGVVLGLAFDGLGAAAQTHLEKLLAERIPGYRPEFPWKRRYKDLAEEELGQPQPPDLPPEPGPEAPDPAREAREEAEAALSDAELRDLRETVRAGDRQTLLRKRGKKVLVVMADELDRTLFLSRLHQDGYRCLFEAASLVQALDAHRKLALDLVVVDHDVARHGALEVVETLRAQGLRAPAAVIRRRPDVRLAVAARAGGVGLLMDHPVDFQGQALPGLAHLLGLES